MRPVAQILLGMTVLGLLGGCQTLGHVQFTVPSSRASQLTNVLHSIAQRHGMVDRTPTSQVTGTLVYFSGGGRSYTDLGARTHKGAIVVDLLFRSAGIGGDLFRALEPEVRQALEQLYPGSVRVERDPEKMVAIPSPTT